MSCPTWKDELARDMNNLYLASSQCLELLEARTDGIELEIVNELRIVTIQAFPQRALDEVWSNLNMRFHTNERTTEQLLQELIHGPIVSASEANRRLNFS